MTQESDAHVAAGALTLTAQAILDEAAVHPRMTRDQRTGVAFAVTIMLRTAQRVAEKKEPDARVKSGS